MAPEQLYRGIREHKVKFTYANDHLEEADVIRYIRDGTLTTDRNKIRTVEPSVYKKIRNRLQKRSPAEATTKQHAKLSSQ